MRSGCRRLLHTLRAVLLCGQLCHGTKNFCGSTWGDASEGCINKQPCASGLDEDCAPGTVCWADTNCDTSKGDGLMYDLNHPSHMRFCGSSWDDASSNCEIKRHCPSGGDDECPKGQECYSFLSNCNYVEMVGGPGEATSLASKLSGDSSKIGLDANDPSRSNFCGYDWNDAISSCHKDDHWCRAGSDSECPSGKVCYAGTDCKYVADLQPTISPTDFPTMSPMSPTASPVVYNIIENTSFCGDSWEKVRSTCRIKSHCPDGDSCPPGFLCYTWVQGCNIIDFEEHLAKTGKEVFGDGRWELPEDGLPEDAAFDQPMGKDGPPKPPAEIESLIFGSRPPNAAPSPPGSSSAEIPPSSQREPTTRAPVEPVDPDAYDAKNHIFCGRTWTDATERCSPDTFCIEGASHRCDDALDYCWVGVTACNGAQYAATPTPVTQTPQPTTIAPTEHETDPKYVPKPVPKPPPSTDIKPSSSSPGEIIEGICAKSRFHLIQTCKTLPACSNRKACVDPYHECYSNVSCPGRPPPTYPTLAVATRSPITPVSSAPVTSAPTGRVITANPTRKPVTPQPIFTSSAPMTEAPVTRRPTNKPVTRRPTEKPTIFTLSEEEVALRYTNINNYCARSYIEVMTSCSYQLTLCNDSPLCLEPGTTCFNNVICPDPLAFGNASPSSSPVRIPSPKTKSPTIRPSHKPTEKPTTKLSPKEDSSAVVQDSSKEVSSPQNYCARPGQVQIDCANGITCNDGEGPCSIGTFCFPAVICKSAIEAPHSPSMPKEAKSSPPVATPNPTRIALTPEPSGSSPNDEAGTNVEAISVCAITSQHAKETCSIAPRCGPGTLCSANLYCFEVICSASATRENYCAHSADQIQGTCSWAPTCNPGDALCPQGMRCFPNSICLSKGQVLYAEYDDRGNVLDHADPGCTNLCLEELSPADCSYADDLTKMGFSLAQCTAKPMAVGDLCIGDGLCGTRRNLNNCGSRDVYIRLDSSNCIDKGLGNSGVIQAYPAVGSGGKSSQPDIDVEQSNEFDTSMKIDFSDVDKNKQNDASEVNWDLGYGSSTPINEDADPPFQNGWWTMKVSSETRIAHAGLTNVLLTLLTPVLTRLW